MSVQRQIDKLIVHRAAEFLEVLRTGRREEYAAFVQWINESPRHLDEFLQLLALSHEARELLRSAPLDPALLAQMSPQITEFPGAGSEYPAQPIERRAKRWMRWTAALAATVATMAIAVLWLTGTLAISKRFETPTGEQRTFQLADGSVVTLNARSQIRVRFRSSARAVELVEGEALFRVARDTRRPFLVHTQDAVVQAVGTQFDVKTRRDGTRVAVVEGKVRVVAKTYVPPVSSVVTATAGTPDPVASSVATPLAAGEGAHISPRGIERVSSEEAARATAWQQRRLIFENTPLEEAVDEFNRYHELIQLRLQGVAAGSHHYSGTFDADDLTSFTDLLSRERDLVVERRGDEIVIRARP